MNILLRQVLLRIHQPCVVKLSSPLLLCQSRLIHVFSTFSEPAPEQRKEQSAEAGVKLVVQNTETDSFISPKDDPRFRYGDVLIINSRKGERQLIGPLKKGAYKDQHVGRLNHDDIVGLLPLTTVETKTGTKFTLHWPSLDEYCTKVKRQANIMYPKDATSAVHLLDLFPGAHVLEAGTGNGSMTLYIQRAIQAPGSHLDTVDIRSLHSKQAEENVEHFWRGLYRPGIIFWRSLGGLKRVIRHLKGEPLETEAEVQAAAEAELFHEDGRPLSALELRRKRLMSEKEALLPNPHPPGHQYDAIVLDLPDCKSVLVDLVPLLKSDRPMCLYMVNMSQILELVQWMRGNECGLTVEKVLEIDWKEWSVRSAAVRSKVRGRVHVGGFGNVSPIQKTTNRGEADIKETVKSNGEYTTAADNIPDDAVGWICRPLHMPIGHTGFLVQLRKTV